MATAQDLIQKPINCVIIPHKHILQFDYQEIEEQLVFFLKNFKNSILPRHFDRTKRVEKS